ncbi:MAG: hypothetical protein M3Y91_06205, partial [Actinomycetota bacterium]|nr:hypothetical protein [Actinomycetota bacterium]
PGPVRAPTSAGPNQLLCEGAAPVRHAGDVLDGLGMLGVWPPPTTRRRPALGGRHPPLDADAESVCQAVGWHPTSCGQIVQRTGLPLGSVSRHLDQLEVLGRITREGDQWSQSTKGGGRAP